MATNTLVEDWITIWNGDYAPAERTLAEDFVVHVALMDGGDVLLGRPALIEWIKQFRAPFTEMTFSIQVGPISENDHVALRWIATGSYGGGFPGATAAIGAKIEFTGTDTLRVAEGKLVEYWLNSDVQVLLAQLGVSG